MLSTPLPARGSRQRRRNLGASLLLPALPTCRAGATTSTRTSLLLRGALGWWRSLLSVCAGCAGISSRDRKKEEFGGGGGRGETCATIASIPHQPGPGPSDADLEWSTPQWAHYCSELQSGGHSFHPGENQGTGDSHTVISGPPPPALSRGSFCPGMTHVFTWFLALWSAPALTSISMISRLPDQAARWITIKPCFPKEREKRIHHLDEPHCIILSHQKPHWQLNVEN